MDRTTHRALTLPCSAGTGKARFSRFHPFSSSRRTTRGVREPTEHPRKAARLGWILRSQEEPPSQSTPKPRVLEGAPGSTNTEPLSGLRTPARPADGPRTARTTLPSKSPKGFSTARACQAHPGQTRVPAVWVALAPRDVVSERRVGGVGWPHSGIPAPLHRWPRETRDLPFWVSASSAVLPTAS